MQLEEVNLNKVDMSENKQTLTEFAKDLINEFRVAFNLDKKEVELKDAKKEVAYEDMTDEEKKAYDAKKKAEKDVDADKVAMSEVETFDIEVFKKAMSEMGLEFSNSVKEVLNPLKDENVALKAQVDELAVKFAKQEETVIELSKAPATKTVRKAPVNFSAMSELDKRRYWKQNG